MYIRLVDKMTMWILDVLCDDDLRIIICIMCNYSILGKWICVLIYNILIPKMICLSSSILYVERISYPLVALWSPTSSWCRRASWGHLIGVSSRWRLDAYSSFLCIYFGVFVAVLWLGCQESYLFYRFCVRETFEFFMRCNWEFGDYDFMRSEMLFRCDFLWLCWFMTVLD